MAVLKEWGQALVSSPLGGGAAEGGGGGQDTQVRITLGASRAPRLATITVAVFTALVLLAPAAPAWSVEPLPERAPPEVDYVFGGDVTAETRWYVETAVAEAWAYLAPLLADAAEFRGKIVVVTNIDDAAEQWSRERGVSLSRARQLFSAGSGSFAGLATTGYTVIINDNYGSAGATIHEFTHLVQRHAAGGSSRGPRWLSEGAAEYFDMAIASVWGIDAGAAGPAAVVGEITEEWSATLDNCSQGLLPADASTCRWAGDPLSRLESAAPFVIGGGAVSAYNRAAVATQLLLDLAGEDSYFCYLAAQGAGSQWRAAFTECFGLDVDAFYRHFDRTRSNGFVSQVPSRFPEMR